MERDDLILDHSYSVAANHDEEHGKEMRKMIWKVTAILSIVTIIEVGLGIAIKHGDALWPLVKFTFLALTLLKAGYIVMEFMHLGQEKKNFRWMLFAPYFIFLAYLVFQLITEASYQGEMLHGTVEAVKATVEHASH